MPRLLTCAAVLAAAIALAACGSSTDDTPAAAAAWSSTVEVRHVDGVGDVLVDSTGHALYTSDQEAGGKIRCTDGCTSFWLPLDPGSGTPTAADGVAKLGVIRRPGGDRQVTMDGKPLYSFSEDTPGKVTGDGFKDEFDGRTFTWNVVVAGGGQSDAAAGGGRSGGYDY